MGKGDIRSRRGKIWRGTTGVTRPRKKSKTPRPAAPSRKVKALKDIPKAIEQAETIPVIEHVQPEIAGVTAEVPQIVSEPANEVASAETTAEAKPKAKKAATKKAPAAKKPAAKKTSAKKK